MAHGVALISVSLVPTQSPAYTARPRIGAYEQCIADVPIYFPAFAGIYCDYPRRDSQAELTWVAGYR